MELALIAPVFFVLFLAIVETAMFYFNASILEGAVRDAVRLVKTGQAQGSGNAQSAFTTQLCNKLYTFISCNSLVTSMQAYNSFAAASAAAVPTLFDGSGNPLPQNFQPGTGNQVVVLQVGYRYTFFTPLVGKVLSPDHSGTVTTSSSSVFRNEPF